ncbi:MAG TPA: hypothetical protein VK138_05140 [Acidiferrobacterales bacterium]|nr:hypothetical protein [Acidiferrobacterales bacterium]
MISKQLALVALSVAAASVLAMGQGLRRVIDRGFGIASFNSVGDYDENGMTERGR